MGKLVKMSFNVPFKEWEIFTENLHRRNASEILTKLIKEFVEEPIKDLRKTIPKRRGRKIYGKSSLIVDEDLWREFHARCAELNITVQDALGYILRKYLRSRGVKVP
ncbi:MAG: hypothetical protein B6U95_00135 [Thermofilum sp. ex4484_82]|nr:MAG: hypothetical protein B6U95_00135 [Thermofilum sp. ex4484_82]OYT40138.1 MAG: hypothetical protein B6U96_00135 [Archaeoglobales archaeon ex4484_92]